MLKVKDEEIVKVYEKKAGNVSATCSALGISRMAFYKRVSKNKGLKEMINEVDESLIDFSESKLIEKISEGDLTAIIFHLKTKGRDRGYVERREDNVNLNGFEKLMKELPDEIE